MENKVSTQTDVRLICKILWKINLCISYPLSDAMIELWATHLVRLMPTLDVAELDSVMDKFIVGDIEYDRDKGITNIFNALKKRNTTFTLPSRK